jgi:plasmid maintenance system killer protein
MITGFQKKVLRKIFQSDRTEKANAALKNCTIQFSTIHNLHLSPE